MKWWLLIGRLVVGGVFLYAGAVKIHDPAGFARDISNYRMLPHAWVNLPAITLPWIEIVSGGMLMLGIWKRANAMLISFLLVIFMAAILQALARGLDIECGCFGTKSGRMTGITTLIQDIVLLAASVWLVKKEKDRDVQRLPIATPDAPRAIGPYAQAVWAGEYLFCSGQIPLDPTTGALVSGGITEQTRCVLDNLRALLRSQHLDLDRVVKTTVFLTDLAHFAAMNEVYAQYFPANPPARSTIQVARLPKDALIEIEAVACR